MPRQLRPTHRLEAKQKGVQKTDGATKPGRNAEKAGCKEAEKDGGGNRPEIRDAKRLWNAAGGRLRLLRQTATATPQLAQPVVAGAGTGSWGKQAKTGDPQAEAPLLSSAGSAVPAHGLYTL